MEKFFISEIYFFSFSLFRIFTFSLFQVTFSTITDLAEN